MSSLLFTIINPVVKGLLRSPVHALMSRNTVLLSFSGRKSGRAYTMAVSYHQRGNTLHCFTSEQNLWWRNLLGAETVGVILRGQHYRGVPTLVREDSARKQSALTEFLTAVPRDASFSGVRLGPDGQPDGDDISRAIEGLVLIVIELPT